MSEEPKTDNNPNPQGEPTATRSTAPMWIIVFTLVLLFLGVFYFDQHSGWFSSKVYSPYDSAEQLSAFQPVSGAAAVAAQGKKVYESVCGICHGNNGEGKPGQAPPLAGSEFVNVKNFNRLAHIPLMGLSGNLKVGGKDWNLAMAPMGATLSDSDLAAVLTYIRSSWGNKAPEVTPDDIKKVRKEIGEHPQPMTGDELMKMAE
jgi:mono/diheme cytochrome c family protein